METGRTFVEMLGVLAVVGVLTIGGIAGYRHAVDRIEANELLAEVRNRAVLCSAELQASAQPCGLSEFDPNWRGYVITSNELINNR
ncbi:MAG: hypothetical protein PHX68_01780 [Alphaproteobacteria bacterium]|nr:hypothetical protein [Alphaproteobacteria bacterium]